MNEVIERRRETSKTFALGGNKYRCVASVGVVHYKDDYSDAKEKWKDIDLTIKNGKCTTAPFELTLKKDSIKVKDKKTGDEVELILAEIPAEFELSKSITLDNTKVRLKLPHGSLIHLAKSKEKTSLHIREREDGDDKLPFQSQKGFVDIDTELKSFTFEANSDVDVDVGADADDKYDNGTTLSNAGNLIFGDAADVHYSSGVRFDGVTVPQGYNIDAANIIFTSTYAATAADTCNANIYAEDADDPATWSDHADYAGRSLTDPVAWNAIVHWGIHQCDADTTTPSLVTPVTTVTSREGWASGQAMCFQVHDNSSSTNAYRAPADYSESAAYAANLVIDYSEGITQKSLAGTLGSSGVIGIKTKVTRAGTLDLAGTVIAKFFHTLAGTLNLTGAISAVYRQIASLAGTLTPSGELNRKISKAVSGTLTPSGALSTVKKIFVSLSGTLNLTGAVLLKILISLIGSLGLSGVISFLINLVGAGAVSVDGYLPQDNFILSKFTADYTSLMHQVRVYASSSGNAKVAVYSDNGGEPDTLLSVVNDSTPVVAGWNKITVPTISINQGTDYWLGFISGV